MIGQRVGSYEVLDRLGEGGMGAVYRARDTKLNRDVALKVLLPEVATDPERLARFRREAQTLAALNHPHIAHIHGLEEVAGGGSADPPVTALVMELVEGEDLAQRLARGPMPVDEALPVARQIAEALEAAHEQGIVHRDLKPANIKVRADGTVKVLDFGLAKALGPDGAGATADASASMSPTMTSPAMTRLGMILGTAAYMAPEQAAGKPVDRRSDLWAFGVVLLEMLTGRRVFEGETVSHVLASVLKDTPDWTTLPPDTPASIRRLLKRCLEKDRKRRIDSAADARLEIEDALAPGANEFDRAVVPSAHPTPLWRRALPLAATALVVSAIAGVLFWSLWPAPPTPPIVTRFPIILPADQQILRRNQYTLAVSPDGARIVYVASSRLYLREMGDMEARPIPGTDVDPAVPFFSPDGHSVGFVSARDNRLYTTAISGGSPVAVCQVLALPFGANWAGDTIVFAVPGGIMRVPASGGDPEVVVKTAANEFADGPQMLDEGRLMFTLATDFDNDRWDRATVVVQSLASGDRRVVVRGGSSARFVPTGLSSPARADRNRGHLVYAVGNALRAVAFDVERLEVIGATAPVVQQVARATSPGIQSGVAHYDVSRTGLLAFVPGVSGDGDELRSLALVGLDGGVERIPLPDQPYVHPRLSPDGRQLAVSIVDGTNANVWVYDLAVRGAPRRLTFEGRNRFPIWAPDGRSVAYQSDREGDFAVFRQAADGSRPAERLTRPDGADRHEPESWSADGKTLSINVVKSGDQSVWVYPVDAGTTPQAIADTPAVEKHSTFSPDGRWIAYMAAVDGSTNVFVQPFPPTGAKHLASLGGGMRTPAWSRDGTRLFLHSTSDNRLVVVDVHAGEGLTFGRPVPVPIEGTVHPIQQRNYDVMPDGKRLLVVLRAETAKAAAAPSAPPHINVVLNWLEELRKRAPTP